MSIERRKQQQNLNIESFTGWRQDTFDVSLGLDAAKLY